MPAPWNSSFSLTVACSCISRTYIVMAYIVMAHVVMAYIVLAYIVMALYSYGPI